MARQGCICVRCGSLATIISALTTSARSSANAGTDCGRIAALTNTPVSITMGLAKFIDQLRHIGIAQGGSFGAYALFLCQLLAILRIPAACRLTARAQVAQRLHVLVTDDLSHRPTAPRDLHRLALRTIN